MIGLRQCLLLNDTTRSNERDLVLKIDRAIKRLFGRKKKIRAPHWPETPVQSVVELIRDLRPVLPQCGMVRIGAQGDGGYLVPDCITGCEACFSPGVSDVSDFEKDCANMGMKVFLADASVEKPALESDRFEFRKSYLGASNRENFITLDRWVSESDVSADSDLVLQMDIEGYEYESFLAVSESLLKRFRVIVVEFHDLQHMFNLMSFNSTLRPTFQKLLATHQVVHHHPNNNRQLFEHRGIQIPPLLETTFLRRDFVEGNDPASQFPHPLDQDNADLPPVVMPSLWYKD